ncbi:MAG: hypothetical protein ACRBEE_12895 [Arenicella sp.]
MMNKELFSDNIAIFYGQFYIDIAESDDEDEEYLDMESAFEGQSNGLCGASHEGKLFFIVGPQDGMAKVTIELHDVEPDLLEGFDDIVECSFKPTNDDLHLCEWSHEETHLLNLPAGEYVVRYSAKNLAKDYGDDDDWDAPVKGQEYIIQFWSGFLAADHVIRSNTEVGQYWHQEMRSK